MMNVARRSLAAALLGLFGGLAALTAPLAAQAEYPDKPIRLIVPFAPGGAADVMGRLVADALRVELKQPVVIINRDGGGTVVGVNTAAKSPADGYTLLISGDAATVNTASGRTLPYDLMADLKPVTLVYSGTQFLIVRKDDKRFQTVADLVKEAKARPGALQFGSSGMGSSLHMSGEIVTSAAQIDALHVPYRGVAPAMNDLAGGQVDFMIAGSSSAIPAIEQGMFRALAVTGRTRSPQLPAVPTLIEQGVPAETASWYGLLVPAATPAPIVQRLNTAMMKILRDKDMAERMRKLGGVPRPMSPEEATAYMRNDIEKFRKVIQARRIKLEN